MNKAIGTVWNYYVSMNSEKDGKVSMKRNIAMVITTLTVFVECWAVVVLGHSNRDMLMYINLIKFLVVANMLYGVLLLGIAKFGEIRELVETIKGNKKEAKSE